MNNDKIREASLTPEFRSKAARLVIDSSRCIALVSNEIGVSAALLGKWVKSEREKITYGCIK